MSYSGCRRLTSQRGTSRSRARRSLVITGVAAVLVLVAGLVVLAVGPGQTTVRTTSVAASRHVRSQGDTEARDPSARDRGGLVHAPFRRGHRQRHQPRHSLSAPLSASTPLPKISPDTAGSWKISGSTGHLHPLGGLA